MAEELPQVDPAPPKKNSKKKTALVLATAMIAVAPGVIAAFKGEPVAEDAYKKTGEVVQQISKSNRDSYLKLAEKIIRLELKIELLEKDLAKKPVAAASAKPKKHRPVKKGVGGGGTGMGSGGVGNLKPKVDIKKMLKMSDLYKQRPTKHVLPALYQRK